MISFLKMIFIKKKIGQNKAKVVFFVQDGVGGAERISVLVGKNLDSEKYEVCFCLIERDSNSSITDFIPDGMRIMRIPNKNPFHLMWKMVTTILREKPYAVFSSVINLNNKYLPFRWLFPKVRVIIRCDNYLYTYTPMQQKIIAILYPKADSIIAQTEEMGKELIEQAKVPVEKVKVLHNPIDKALIYKKLSGTSNPYPENGKKHFVAVGRFNIQKGFDMLIDAFIEVNKKKKDVDLFIVGDYTLGDGEIYNNLKVKVNNNGISDLVHCVGYKDNPYIYLKYADCFVLSSRWEGLPNVLIESLYLGTPAAAFKCIPVIERIINDGVTGYCAEKENISSLAKAMIDSLNLGVITSSYKSSSISDFTELFDSDYQTMATN